MRRTLSLAALLCLALAPLAPAQTAYEGGDATEPAARDADWWTQLHEKFLDRARQGEVDLLFLGDSITQGWNDNDVWKRYYGPRRPANFGIGGDRTQHVLWRLDHGEAEGFTPKAVVLMIGTNNIGSDSPKQIAEGNRAILDRIHKAWPEAKVLLLGVFPRGADRQTAAEVADLDPRPAEINAILKTFDDRDYVTYLDISRAFLDDSGKLPKSIMPDFLHLSPEGYRRWAEAMEPALWELCH
jgi:beta-glucosidase